MADPAYAFPAETDWLRCYLRDYSGAVFFDVWALRQMWQSKVSMVSVLYVLRNKPVIESEPDPSGAHWVVEGEDEHDRLLTVTLRVDAGVIRVEVIDVRIQ